MNTFTFMFALAAAGVLGLSACDRAPEGEPARQQPAPVARTRSPDAADLGGRQAGSQSDQQASAGDWTDPRQQGIPVHDDGTPLWAANRSRTAQENAERQFKRNGK